MQSLLKKERKKEQLIITNRMAQQELDTTKIEQNKLVDELKRKEKGYSLQIIKKQNKVMLLIKK